MLHFDHEFYSDQDTVALMEDALASLEQEKESGRIGYYFLPGSSMDLLDEIDSWHQKESLLMDQEIENIALIGIGGSSLGIKAIHSLLDHKTRHKKLHFFENSDPLNITKTLSQLEKKNTLFIVVSKSGSTIETISIFKTVIAHFDLKLESKDGSRVLVITDAGSVLSRFADSYHLKQFNIPANVGGRFSVLSTVGVVPLYLAGYDVKSILQGADEFVKNFFGRKEEHLLHKAAYYASHAQSKPINVMFSYANELENLTKWYVQLWGESLGKVNVEGEHVGLTPIGLIGAVDQHSFLQLIIEGPPNKSVTFININDFENDLLIPDISLPHIEKTDFVNGTTFGALINAQCLATKKSLQQNSIPVDSITFDRIHERNIGKIIIYYELLTSLVGAMLHVNTYDQPGVEQGKKLLYEYFQGVR